MVGYGDSETESDEDNSEDDDDGDFDSVRIVLDLNFVTSSISLRWNLKVGNYCDDISQFKEGSDCNKIYEEMGF